MMIKIGAIFDIDYADAIKWSPLIKSEADSLFSRLIQN